MKTDGQFHAITVKVNRPDAQVRTRKGYYADAVTPAKPAVAVTPSLKEVSQELLPERGLPMSTTVAPFRGPSGTPIVVITTGVRASAAAAPGADTRPGPGEQQFEPIEILTSALRDGAKEAEWQRQRLSLVMPDTGPGELRYESVSTLTLKPGRYEVRVATRHERADVIGSVHTFVDVPDFESQPLTLSGLVLFDRTAPTATPAEAIGGVLDKAPTTRREFTQSDDVTAFARVYQKAGTQPAAVTIAFRVLDRALNEVTGARIALTPDQFTASGADGRFKLPLDTLPPGSSRAADGGVGRWRSEQARCALQREMSDAAIAAALLARVAHGGRRCSGAERDATS